jgi:hypothetical protein
VDAGEFGGLVKLLSQDFFFFVAEEFGAVIRARDAVINGGVMGALEASRV